MGLSKVAIPTTNPQQNRNSEKSGNEGKAQSVTAVSPPSTKAEIGGKKSYRAVSSASDFRNDGWAQTVKNLSAILGYFAGSSL